MDPWDKLRDGTVDLLAALPAPLPGLEAPPGVADLMSAGRRLLLSLRVRESDAGADRARSSAGICNYHEPGNVQ